MRMILAICLALSSAAAGAAAPCEGVNRALTGTRRHLLAPLIARQLGAPSVVILESMVMRSWSVIWVSVPGSGSPFLFYASDPEHSRYVTLWSGAARTASAAQFKAWALAHAPGIPPPLANCFAWHVGVDRE